MPTLATVAELWADLPQARREKNEKSLSYIQELANLQGVNINRWDILKTFGVGNGRDLLGDVNQINQAFFGKMLNQKVRRTVSASDPSTPPPELMEGLRRYLRRTSSSQVQSLRRSLEQVERSANRAYNNYLNEMQKARDLNSQIRLAEDAGNHVQVLERNAKMVMQAINGEDAWLSNMVVGGGNIWFTNREPVVLRHVNRSARIDVQVDMGHYAIGWSMTNGDVKVRPFRNNKFSVGYFHPHVRGDGGVCWGSALSEANRAIRDLDLLRLLRMLHTVLFEYNDDSPYQPLSTFADARVERRPNTPHPNPDWEIPQPVELEDQDLGTDPPPPAVPVVESHAVETEVEENLERTEGEADLATMMEQADRMLARRPPTLAAEERPPGHRPTQRRYS